MAEKSRSASVNRKTNEVDIICKFSIDGKGKTKIDTGFDSLNHMLELFCFHGFFDLELKLKRGDLKHHIVEDIGITLGEALKKAIGKAEGIKRYSNRSVPMDSVIAHVAVDISGRPSLTFLIGEGVFQLNEKFSDLKTDDFKIFLESFVANAKISLNVKVPIAGEMDSHHVLEAIFKALGLALDDATQIEPRRKGIPSTKGRID
ncbi:MAG: imidazoleglycerol-phosphate dehydratase [Candidatus Omnitrophica bacterium]|nr:imidazoleglycerol-phosphate dehydratase [Candidatus Omnitrophota bacterium]